MDLTPQDVQAITALIAAVFALVSLALVWLVRRAVRQFEKVTGLAVPASVGTQLESYARMGASYAEEQARKAALGALEGPTTGPQKLEVAISAARSLAPGSLQELSDQQVAIAVESQLPSIRPPAESSPSIRPTSLLPQPPPRLPALGPIRFDTTDTPTSPQTPISKGRP